MSTRTVTLGFQAGAQQSYTPDVDLEFVGAVTSNTSASCIISLDQSLTLASLTSSTRLINPGLLWVQSATAKTLAVPMRIPCEAGSPIFVTVASAGTGVLLYFDEILSAG